MSTWPDAPPGNGNVRPTPVAVLIVLLLTSSARHSAQLSHRDVEAHGLAGDLAHALEVRDRGDHELVLVAALEQRPDEIEDRRPERVVPGDLVVHQEALTLEGLDHPVRRREREARPLRDLGEAERPVLLLPAQQDPEHAVHRLRAALEARVGPLGGLSTGVNHGSPGSHPRGGGSSSPSRWNVRNSTLDALNTKKTYQGSSRGPSMAAASSHAGDRVADRGGGRSRRRRDGRVGVHGTGATRVSPHLAAPSTAAARWSRAGSGSGGSGCTM